MSTYAIIKTGGKQVKVEVGQAIYVEKLDVEAGSEVTFNEVVLVGGENTVVGTPLVAGATVVGTVEKQGKQKKKEIKSCLSKNRPFVKICGMMWKQ